MSTLPGITTGRVGTLTARLSDYAELGKIRIASLELVVVTVAASLATGGLPAGSLLVPLLLGTTLIAISASAANQWLERDLDARMPRTRSRPLPAGRVSMFEAVSLAAATLLAGVWMLGIFVNWTTATVAIATWIVYVVVYTPLKTRSPLNTAVGAVSGCLPVLIGWTATGAPLSLTAAALTVVLFLWQFPHFMAIAWLYRDDYRAGGFQMLTVVDPSGLRGRPVLDCLSGPAASESRTRLVRAGWQRIVLCRLGDGPGGRLSRRHGAVLRAP